MAERDRRQAEEACQRADELFRCGDIRGARREARAAKRLCPSLPAAASALACYDIHAATAARYVDWREVLGMPPGAAFTAYAFEKQFRHMSLLVHPDKSRCAAAEGAFKLLRQACDILVSASSGNFMGPRGCGPPGGEQRDDHPSPRRKREWKEHERRRREERRGWRQEPICPYKVIHCPFCAHDFVRLCGPLQEQGGTACRHCGRWLSPPWQKKPEPTGTTPRPEDEEFPCPARCPECGTQYKAIVSVAKWCLRCKACGKKAVVDVQGSNVATATKTGRP